MANKYYVIRDLKKQYAKLLGHYVHAERKVEKAKGLKSIDAATAEVAAEREQLRRQMDAITLTIQANYDLNWSPIGIKPIRPTVTGKHGDLSAAIYKTLKQADGPISTADVIQRVAELLSLDLSDPELKNHVRSSTTNLLKARVKDGLVIQSERPTRWSRAPRPTPVAAASANTLPTPWR